MIDFGWGLSQLRLCIFIFTLLLFRLKGGRYFVTVHELAKLNHSTRYRDFWLRYFIERAQKVFVHHQPLKDSLVKAFRIPAEKIYFQFHGSFKGYYASDITQAIARKMLGLPEKSVVFLVFGSLNKYKSIEETIDAFQKANAPRAILIVAGAPPKNKLSRCRFLEMIEERKSEKIIFFPHVVRDEEIQYFMKASNAVIVNYGREFVSGVALLASSFGRVCLSPSRAAHLQYLAQPDSLQYSSTDELTEVIRRCSEKPEELTTLGNLNEQMSRNFPWQNTAKELKNLYYQ